MNFKYLKLRPYYYTCPKCRTCCYTNEPDYLPLCPSYHYYKSIVYSGAGKNKIAGNLHDENIKISPDLADAVYKCTLCLACDEQCVMSCKPVRTGINIRQELVDKNFEIKNEIKENILKYYNPYAEKENRFYQEKSNSEFLIFLGCEINYKQKSIIESLIKILNLLDISYSFLQDERCCGFPLYQLGYAKDAEGLANYNFKILKKKNKKVLFLCPNCYYNFKFLYKFDMEMTSVTEFLEKYLDNLKFKEKSLEKITYHDPCYLGRGCKIYSAPRNILNKIPDIQLVEMNRTKNLSLCCGAGGGVNFIYPDFAKWSAKERINEAKNTGAETLITSCPLCKSNMEDASDRLKILDITEYVCQKLLE